LATIEATKLGYNVPMMAVLVENSAGPFNACIDKHAGGKYTELRKAKLSGKKYYTVYFSPKTLQKGSDICLFIDRYSGEIIADYRGK
jgi:hypothetical protein